MAKSGRIIKLSKNLKPFVSRAVRDGRVQKAFAAKASASNQCVKNALAGKTGMTGVEVHNVVKDCARSNFPKGTKL